jgi:hypothetical protein
MSRISRAISLTAPRTDPDDPASAKTRPHASDLLLPVSLLLWALGVDRTDVAALGPYGLPPALPVLFYAGLALLVVSAGIELARPRPSPWRMSLHVVALVVMLYGTAPLVYSEGRYTWLYKTIGVIQYVNVHGQLNPSIDIYQQWPGFFALAAWFGKVAGVASPAATYAKWAQLVFELAALPLLNLAYEALSLTARQRWIALLLYPASNWIGQDYLSPQALGTLLSLGVTVVALRWLYVNAPAEDHQPDQIRYLPWWKAPLARISARSVRSRALACAVIVIVYFVLTFTHELSPYMVAVQLGALAVAGLLRPRWFPLVLAAIAFAYLAPRFSFVNRNFGILNSIGDFFGNAEPQDFTAGVLPPNQRLVEHCQEALSAGMWVLAVAGAWLRRRSGRSVLALVLLTFSPFILLGALAYGQELILRVELFSLPWTAALAALALASPRTVEREVTGYRASPALSVGLQRHLPKLTSAALRVPLVLGLALALFFPAFFGDDSYNMMPRSEVTAITSFLGDAAPGPLYIAIGNVPTLVNTGRYNLFPLVPIFGGGLTIAGTAPVTPGILNIVTNFAREQTGGRKPAYIVIAPSMTAYNQAYRVTPPSSFTTLLMALAHDHRWKLVVRQSGTVIYELPPTVPSLRSSAETSAALVPPRMLFPDAYMRISR